MELINELTQHEISELESQIISALIFNGDDRSFILSKVNLEHFNNQNNRIIYKVIKDLLSDNNEIDSTIILQSIQNHEYDNKDDIIKQFNDGIYLYGYVQNLESKIKMLINYSVKRKIDIFASEILEQKIDPLNSKEKFASWSDKLNQIIDTQDVENLEHIKDSVDVYTHKLFESIHNDTSNKLTGITSGYEAIDEYTNGFQNGDLIILAARPSVGKTALAINFILNAAKTLEKNECIVMFSLEMSKEQIIQRMLSNLASIDSRILRSSRIDKDYIMSLSNNSEILKNLPIYIDDSPNTTMLDIEAKLRQFIKSKKVKLVVVDYLQLINGISGSSINRVTEVGKISRHLKNLARSLEVPIIAIAQLSRKIEERRAEDRQPMLSDLRESGNIEQDADLVTFIDIDYSALQMNNKLKDTNMDFNKYKAKNPQMIFYIEKHRNGLTGTVKLVFNKSTGQFVGVNSNNTKGFN